MPQAASENQQPGGNIILHFLPGGLHFYRREPFLEHGEIERVSQFEPVKCGKGQRVGVGLPPRIGLWRIVSVE